MSKRNSVAGKLLRKDHYQQEAGKHYGTPKEIWGFRMRAARGSPQAVARSFLAANAKLFLLDADLRGIHLRKSLPSLGAHHVMFQQEHGGIRVHRAYVTVHMDRAGRVYLAKNRSMPARLLPSAFDDRIKRVGAVARARKALPECERLAKVVSTERMWFPYEHKLLPAWKVRLVRVRPREEWIVYVNARTHGILSRYDNLSESATKGRGMVFYPSPVVALGGHAGLLSERGVPRRPPLEAYRIVPLEGIDRGYLRGSRVSTEATPGRRVRRPDGQFMFESYQNGFQEVMVYYHIDAAIRYLERLGYRGARAIFKSPIQANAEGTRDDNSWYSPWDRQLTFGTGGVDDAEDGETILHELGHAIQDAICPDFGQSKEAAAMGEGFGDYFAASFFEPVKPAGYRTSVMSWDGLLAGLEAGLQPPCLRRLDEPLTYADFRSRGDEHVNGQIWSATLWDVRNALGRDAAARVIVESHFQLDGFTTFARGARAILDADRNLEGGRHVDGLTRLFGKRGIGPV